MTNILSSNIALLLRRLLILTLAGLLVFYHLVTLYELYLADGNAAATYYDHIQSVCRVGITISLLLVVLENSEKLKAKCDVYSLGFFDEIKLQNKFQQCINDYQAQGYKIISRHDA